jgi:hypothetical protein
VEVISELHAPVALSQGRLAVLIQQVGPRAGLDALEKKQKYLPLLEIEPRFVGSQAAAKFAELPYTRRSIAAYCSKQCHWQFECTCQVNSVTTVNHVHNTLFYLRKS